MEAQNLFDLNNAINRWRAELTTHETLTEAELHELETHLRDAITTWQARGLTDSESFLIASTRLGAPATIAAEFAKEDPLAPWRSHLFWMLVGALSLVFVNQATHLIVTSLGILAVSYLGKEAAYIPAEFINPEMSDNYIREWVDIPGVTQLIISIAFPALLFFTSRWLTARNAARRAPNPSRTAFGITLIVLLAGTNLLDAVTQTFLRGLVLGEEGFHFQWTTSTMLLSLLCPMVLAILVARFAPPRFMARS